MPRPLGPLPGPRRWRAGGGSISSWLACEETRPRAFVTRNVAPVWPPTARGRRSLFRAKQWGVVHAASLGVSPGKTPIPVWQYGAGGGPERQTEGRYLPQKEEPGEMAAATLPRARVLFLGGRGRRGASQHILMRKLWRGEGPASVWAPISVTLGLRECPDLQTDTHPRGSATACLGFGVGFRFGGGDPGY